MGNLVEKLQYILDFNTAGGVRSLQQLGKTAETELGKAEKKLDKLGTGLTKFGAGAVATAGVVGAALFKMGQGAADTQASFSALNQVVGETSANGFAEWAEDGAEKVGLAKGAIYEAATTFGMFGKEANLAGSELDGFIRRQITMAADWAAFKNTTPEQVIEDMRAAYAGSSETLQKYIGTVNDAAIKQAVFDETGEKVTGTLTGQQRIIGLTALMMEKGADMAGQFARESGELAGQQVIAKASAKNLADEIGEGVVPMMTALFEVASKVIGALSRLNDVTGGNLGQWAAYGTAGLAAVGAMSLIVGQIIKLRTAFIALRGVMIGHPLLTIASVIGIAVTAFTLFTGSTDEAKVSVDELADAMRDLNDPFEATVNAVAALANDDASLLAWLDATGMGFTDVANAALGGENAMGTFIIRANQQAAAAGNQVKFNQDLENTLLGLVPTAEEAIRKYEAMTRASGDQAAASDEAASSAEHLAEMFGRVGSAAELAGNVGAGMGRLVTGALESVVNTGQGAVEVGEQLGEGFEESADRVRAAFDQTRASAEAGLEAIASGYADTSEAAEMSATEIVEAQRKATAAQDAWLNKVELLKAAYGDDLIGDVLAYAAEQGPEIGQKLIDGLASGEITPSDLESMFGDMDTQAERAATTAIEVATDAAEDTAASEWPRVGSAAIDGLVAGILSNSGRVSAAVDQVSREAMAAMRNAFGIGSGGAGGGRAAAQ